MGFYNKIDLPELVSVNSVVSALRAGETGIITATPDMHDFWEIVYVRCGTFSVLVDGVRFDVPEGEALIYPPLSLHIGTMPQSPIVEIISFESDSEILPKIAGKIIKLTDEERALITDSVELGIRMRRAILTSRAKDMIPSGASRAKLQVLKKKIELLLTSVYAGLADEPASEHRGYKREYSDALTKFLRMNINKSLTLEDMAKELSISVSRLKAISGEILGAPPIDYFITLKLEAAAKLIRDGELNFTEISEKLGFSSVHYFSKLFKRRVGMTPTEYSKTH